jgi:hypothetical protein
MPFFFDSMIFIVGLAVALHGLRPGREWLGALGFFIAFWSGVPALMFIIAHAEHASASHGSYGVSASCYGRAENVGVVPVVITPFKFRNIQREIFPADHQKSSFLQRPG